MNRRKLKRVYEKSIPFEDRLRRRGYGGVRYCTLTVRFRTPAFV